MIFLAFVMQVTAPELPVGLRMLSATMPYLNCHGVQFQRRLPAIKAGDRAKRVVLARRALGACRTQRSRAATQADRELSVEAQFADKRQRKMLIEKFLSDKDQAYLNSIVNVDATLAHGAEIEKKMQDAANR